MHYVTIPAEVVGDIPEDAPGDYKPARLKFVDLVTRMLPNDERGTADLASILKMEELLDGVAKLKEGDVWEMTDALWEFLSLLVRTYRTPQGGAYHPLLKPKMYPIFRAVAGAPTKDPRVKVEATAAEAQAAQ